MKNLNSSKNESQLKRERINFLIEENKESDLFLKENRDNFKKWLDDNFKNASHDGNCVDIKDDSNTYEYTMQDDILKLKKRVKSKFGRRGFGFGGHPMEYIMDLMEMKEIEKDETVYEGGYTPKNKEVENLFPLLKEDLINKGEICTAIKKFISEDRKVRLMHQDRTPRNRNEISKLESEIKFEQQKELIDNFTPEKLSVLFENNTVLLKGICKYNFNNYNGNVVKSIKFKKETPIKYYLEFVFDDNEEETINVDKKDFKITKYIY
jgi:hypothetical protein